MTVPVCLGLIVLSLMLALASRRGHAGQSLRDYLTASRQFGAVLVFFLSVGETYSIGGLLGFPGGVYARGVPFATWFVAYIVLSAPVGYLVNPLIWRAARRLDALTIADLYAGQTRSRALGVIVALCAIGFLIPWGAMQFAGLNVALSGLGLRMPRLALMAGSAALAFSYLALSGVRAPAYVSVLKDIALIGAIVLVAGAVLHAGFPAGTFARAWPHMPATGPLLSTRQEVQAMTTTLFQALGLYMSPLTMAYIFTARSAGAIRRAQIPMPLYMAMFPALTVVALAARAGALSMGTPNDAFIASARAMLPPSLVGFVAGAATLAGLVVLAGTCLVIGPLIARNLVPHLPEARQKSWAQGAMVGYLVLSMALATAFPGLIVTMNNLTYLGITQFLPGILVIGLGRAVAPRILGAGLLTGDFVGVGLFLGGVDTFGVNPGLIGLVLNMAIVARGLNRAS